MSSACRRATICVAAMGSLLLLPVTSALSAPAVLTGISVTPPEPTTCDPVSITAAGELPACYEIVRATIRAEAIPCASPLPCTRFHVEITVREPAPGTVCPAVTLPYTRSFDVSRLPAGVYSVSARERIVPFAADSTDTTVGESFATANFAVRGDPACSPQGCYILTFTPDRLTDPYPTPSVCTAVVSPGGTACLAVSLQNEPAVGGLQTKLVFPPIVTASDGPGRFFRTVSVEAIGRAAGFQVAWTTEASETRILLYSTSGATIPAGSGPVLRVCYAVASETPRETFFVQDMETIVADADGVSMIPCPTFRRIPPGMICVGSPASCDVNGDGNSDVLDVIRIVRCALGGMNDSTSACPDPMPERADCNGDGVVNIRDVICCVRKIVSALGTTDFIRPPALGFPGQGNTVGFEGSVRWISAVDGVAVVRIDAAGDWGGTQFRLNPQAAPVRIRDLKLLDGDATNSLEWAIGPSGVARAMLYGTATGTRPARTYRLEVALERVPGGTGALHIEDLKAGTSAGEEAGIATSNPSVQIDAAPVAAPALLAARPNPSAGETEIGFVLPADARVTLRVYDVAGRLVRTLVDEVRPAGVHRARWDGTDDRGNAARTGLYFTKMNVGSRILSERVLLLR